MQGERYRDRVDAGRRLGEALAEYAGRSDVLVLALPRGGVPVAFEVARALDAPLDLFLVRKLGVPGHEELAMGAIAMGGIRIVNQHVVDVLRIPDAAIAAAAAQEEVELRRRDAAYRGDRLAPEVRGRTTIVVDDGLATGATMRAAVAALRAGEPAELVVAVPVAARETVDALAAEVDRVVCPLLPESFQAVGLWYDDFTQTTDAEVRDLLARADAEHPASAPPGGGR